MKLNMIVCVHLFEGLVEIDEKIKIVCINFVF